MSNKIRSCRAHFPRTRCLRETTTTSAMSRNRLLRLWRSRRRQALEEVETIICDNYRLV
ncbi:unnamed protein product [Amoebophrya sp. A120]|nr:unnamed protein product [Amoebophrya sp. A120]|eukprot:GSA120T00024613001.1